MNDMTYNGPIGNALVDDSSVLTVLSIQDVANKLRKRMNDHLKTPQEIESEMCIAVIAEQTILDIDQELNGETDGYIHIDGTDIQISGPLEENY